jgi:ferredoxin
VKPSTEPAESGLRDYTWRPHGTAALAAAVRGIDRVFDAVYGSRYNPLYRTGTLSALFLAVALLTGVYLLFVYEIGRPYESVEAIQRDILVGRWIRALHRYASDAALIAAALHVARLLVQGKTWGPRALAWVTGVGLTGMMLLSAITGFVLVWDAFAQKLAVTDRAATSQFFFMNLFLHVAVPLGMVAFLWLHTARLARAAWFPERRIVWGSLAGAVALAFAWPAPLPPAADLLTVPGRIATDWCYGFWLPLAEASPAAALAAMTLLVALLVAVPWLLRPPRAARPAPAFADAERCEGCKQCFADCPYDAIEMVAGKYPERHALRAEVQPSLCVSCGLCAGSCASLAIGPPARTAAHQLAAARQLVASLAKPQHTTVVLACRGDVALTSRLRAWAADRPAAIMDLACAGTLHPGTVSYLGSHARGVAVIACPPANCMHREGAALADARILLERPPAIPGRLSGQHVRVMHTTTAEWRSLQRELTAFAGADRAACHGRPWPGAALAAGFSVLLLALLASGSRAPQGRTADHAVLRLGWRLPGQVKETCRTLTEGELAQRPAHMRVPRECVSEALAYDMSATVDGRVIAEGKVRASGLRADRPLTVEEEHPLEPGRHDVVVSFTPEDARARGRALRLARQIAFEPGRVVLITIEGEELIALTASRR